MTAMRGGARPGAGRKPGGRNKLTVEREIRAAHGVEAALDTGLLPLDVLLARVRNAPLPNGEKPTDEQFVAACAAAPYLHPRLAAATIKATVATQAEPPGLDLDRLTPEQRENLRAVLLIAGPRLRAEGQ